MNHAERVKLLLHDAQPIHGLDELHTAIDAMQSALDDANAKLAARDAEVERLRKDAERYQWLRDKADGDIGCGVRALSGPYFNNPCRGGALDSAIDAALSEEVKGVE